MSCSVEGTYLSVTLEVRGAQCGVSSLVSLVTSSEVVQRPTRGSQPPPSQTPPQNPDTDDQGIRRPRNPDFIVEMAQMGGRREARVAVQMETKQSFKIQLI